MTQTIRRSDKDLQTNVTDELLFDSSVDAAHLVVLANAGVVTLSGDVGSLPERHTAKRAAMRVAGVQAVTIDIVVRDPDAAGTRDGDIADAANQMLSWAVDVPSETITADVRDHIVTLSGTATRQYQREAAARAVMYLKGVTAVTNAIVLSPATPASDLKTAIDAAILRNAQLDSAQIRTEVNGAEVTLRGSVRSWAERRQSENVAWSGLGVTGVQNHLTVTA
ncbi:BON domain-containing protein [Plantactinospora soyae]|uniref:Osmotically-inducible protein OsmY n=1 Tax=Plantactinospora soyae TaxID=1544732 RepID=A0A927QZ69_9ACTN|nr:BON domain-containing protein [Plantactinospora soyae]MBE1490050.1 osmotically-inducible protein OsmY [Plantactinospora soyae]